MKVRHHPEAETLVAYAGGNLAEGFALVVAVHLAVCSACRDTMSSLEALGGVLLDDLPPTQLAAEAFAKTMARIGDQAPEERPATPAAADPASWWEWPPLGSYLDGRAPRWWIPLGPGIGYSPVKRRGRSGASAILLRIAPGAALPHHGHSGTEMNVILEGGYNDGANRFEIGDFSANEIGFRHKPTADADDYCVTLAGLGGPLEFGGAPVRFLQSLAGI